MIDVQELQRQIIMFGLSWPVNSVGLEPKLTEHLMRSSRVTVERHQMKHVIITIKINLRVKEESIGWPHRPGPSVVASLPRLNEWYYITYK